jgi:RNA polymerase sigma factor (sigma-70 family)
VDSRSDDTDALAQLEPVLRRLIIRGAPAGAIDDLVQDALERVLAARRRLTPESLVAYGVVVARSILVAERRRAERRERLEPRLADARVPELPDEAALAVEEREAIRAALGHLRDVERDALVRHEVGGTDIAHLARESGTTPGAVAARLSRARARLRVEYVLAIRRVRLPSEQCHPVLLTLSAGDTRRQRRLGAGSHLLECPACAALAPALVERRRALAGLLPFGAATERARRWVGEHPRQTATAGAGGVIVTVIVVSALLRPSEPRQNAPTVASPSVPAIPPACAELTIGGQAVTASSPQELESQAGQGVEADGVLVDSVPADEGFWIRCGTLRLWVELAGSGESPVAVRTGQRVRLAGTLATNGHEEGRAPEVGTEEGVAELAAQRVHIDVMAETVSVS